MVDMKVDNEYTSELVVGGYVQFVVEYTTGKSSMTGIVKDVGGWDTKSNTPVMLDDYMSFYIKWDGCSHVWFGEPEDPDDPHDSPRDGYLHLCGKHCWQDHIRVLNHLWDLACDHKVVKPYSGESWCKGELLKI
jgi:hypothetical protein